MEEILASIRRIISEDAEPGDSEPGGGANGQPDGDTESVLELTQMVQEDGSTIDLTEVDAPPDTAPPVGRADDAESEAEPPPDMPSEPPSASEPLGGDDPAPSPDPEPEHDVPAAPEAAPEIHAGPEAAPETPAAPEAMPEVQAGAAAETPAGPEAAPDAPSEAGGAPEPPAAPAAEADAGPPADRPAPEDEAANLITGTSAAASIESFADLARTVEPEPEPIEELRVAGSGRTVEDLVREIMEPMLREWFDNNLPDLIERLVRKEIRDLVRRSQPD